VAAAGRTYKQRPAFWHTLRSELSQNAKVFAQPVPSDESHGALPLVVLSAADTYADAPANDRKALDTARLQTQRRLAASSSRGELQPVAMLPMTSSWTSRKWSPTRSSTCRAACK